MLQKHYFQTHLRGYETPESLCNYMEHFPQLEERQQNSLVKTCTKTLPLRTEFSELLPTCGGRWPAHKLYVRWFSPWNPGAVQNCPSTKTHTPVHIF